MRHVLWIHKLKHHELFTIIFVYTSERGIQYLHRSSEYQCLSCEHNGHPGSFSLLITSDVITFFRIYRNRCLYTCLFSSNFSNQRR